MVSTGWAQRFGANNPGRKFKGKKEKTSWIFGAGWNIVDDNGEPFKHLFDISKAWSMPFYPSQLSTEILGRRYLSYGILLSYNRYKAGKVINNVEIKKGRYNFFSADAFVKYHLKYHVKIPPRFDPYAVTGLGYTSRGIGPYNSTFTYNLGIGTNIWINNIVGINIQSIAKFGLRSPIFKTGSNYLHHSFGLVFILDRTSKRRFSFVRARYAWIHEKRKNRERE